MCIGVDSKNVVHEENQSETFLIIDGNMVDKKSTQVKSRQSSRGNLGEIKVFVSSTFKDMKEERGN